VQVVLKNEESWNMLKDDSLNSSSEQKNSDLQANTREKNESNLWSEFKQKELQLKQKVEDNFHKELIPYSTKILYYYKYYL
tara:strand:- start:837 stop:1079 length:243 start_codon:yes stop_codon:yes gene_type:complete